MHSPHSSRHYIGWAAVLLCTVAALFSSIRSFYFFSSVLYRHADCVPFLVVTIPTCHVRFVLHLFTEIIHATSSHVAPSLGGPQLLVRRVGRCPLRAALLRASRALCFLYACTVR